MKRRDKDRNKKPIGEGVIDIFAEDDAKQRSDSAHRFTWDTENILPIEGEEAFAKPRQTAAQSSRRQADADLTAAPTDVPEAVTPEAKSPEIEAEPYTFDKHGKRVPLSALPRRHRRQEQRYGRRANVPLAPTKLWERETVESRLRREAAERSRARAEGREKEYERELQLERAQRRAEAARRRRAFVYFVLGVLALAVLFWFALQIRKIEVVGTLTRYTQDEIINASGIKIGTHILLADLPAAKQKLAEDPYLVPEVEYIFPSRVLITLRERVPIAAVRWGEDQTLYAIIDNEGIVLKPGERTKPQLLEVLGISVMGVRTAGMPIGDAADDQIFALVAVIQKLNEYGLLSYFTSLDVGEPMRMHLMTPQGYRVELGDLRDLDLKCMRMQKHAAAILQKAEEYMRGGAAQVTVYLYSKNGVTVSPYPPDYIIPSEPVTSPNNPASTPSPNDDGPPLATPVPTLGGDPFTG